MAPELATAFRMYGPTESWVRRIVEWYETRWGIEEFFRGLRSGMHIEDRRLRTADALKQCLVFDAVTAWKVFSRARMRSTHRTPRWRGC
ncbi:MAG: transposase [Bryobacterales bacterium]|nr:transposase [Bryobacterales bacterium]